MMMKFLLIVAVLCYVVNAAFIHMEKALIDVRTDLINLGEASPDQLHEVIFSVKLRNMDVLEKFVLDVSKPGSPNFGKHLTRAEVATLTANPEATQKIVEYLNANGAKIVRQTPYGEMIAAEAPVSLWEKLFATTFYNFDHDEKRIQTTTRSLHYSIESELAPYVDAVFNTAQLPMIPHSRIPPKPVEGYGASGTVIPSLLNSYYNITSNTGSTATSQSVFEALSQYYSPSDLTKFQTNYGLPIQAVYADVGGYVSDSQCTSNANNCAEANLDVQYMMAISQVTPMTYWYETATGDIFVAWIEAIISASDPPKVNSISYGGTETSTPTSIANTFNNACITASALGVTIMVSSGDDGVAGNSARRNPNNCGYSPSWPATAPYVTAVGATQGPESGTTEIMCASNTGGVITSGGGFSTIFSAPSWQTSAIATYFSTVTTQPVSGYTASGRGYPDISLLGYNYAVVIGGSTYGVSGTSASSPSFAALVALVNAARVNAGKSNLGFINQGIYEGYASFAHDITSGTNNCTAGIVCCSQGFASAVGWDPTTGYGSVDYPSFFTYFYNL